MASEKELIGSTRVRKTQTIHPIMVMAWELRRLAYNRSSWILAGTALVCFSGILWVRHTWQLTENLFLFGTSAYGLLGELVYDLMIVFGVILPFLATDSVAHDYKQRMHELLMTTAAPTRVYILGRYLASFLVSLGLAIIMFIAQSGMNWAMAGMDPGYPAPNVLITLVIWGVIVLPATTLVCSLCFALGVFFPRFTIVSKLAVVIVWVILVFDTDPRDLGWRAYWNPTGAGLTTTLTHQLSLSFQALAHSIPGAAQQAQIAMRLQQQMPDLRPWIGPYLSLAAVGILLVVLSTVGFQRFRDVLGK